MVPMSITSPETGSQEPELLASLLGLYGRQQSLYGEILELSRRQLALVREGAPLSEIRRLLSDKKARLEMIRSLDHSQTASRQAWRQGRQRWTAAGRAQLQRALLEVGKRIEEILACEEENDRALLHHCR